MVKLAGYSSHHAMWCLRKVQNRSAWLHEICSIVVKTREHVLGMPLLQTFAPYHSEQGCTFSGSAVAQNTSKQALLATMSALLTDNCNLTPQVMYTTAVAHDLCLSSSWHKALQPCRADNTSDQQT